MNTIERILGISLIVVTLLMPYTIEAQRRTSSTKRTVKTERRTDINRSVTNTNRYRTQPIHRNPRYRYPNRHRVVRTLPRHHVHIVYRGLPYYYYGGIYYTIYGDEYIVVMPPVGFRVGVLPVGHVRIIMGPRIVFYHSGVYYVEKESPKDENDKYEVIQPEVGVVVNDIHEDSEKIKIDGNAFYEYNNVIYKKTKNIEGKKQYEIVYINNQEE